MSRLYLSNLRIAPTAAFLLATFLNCVPVMAQDDAATAAKLDAAAAMQTWLGEIDAGNYAPSWTDASASFKKAVTSDQWVAALNSVRIPLGKLVSRKQVSSLYQTSIPQGAGKTMRGEFVIAQFDSSFENLKYAVETVTFEKEPDGTWRAAGYFVKPGS